RRCRPLEAKAIHSVQPAFVIGSLPAEMLLSLVVTSLASAYAQLYPTLIQPRPIYLPSHLQPNLQVESPEVLAGTVPVYEPVYPPQQTIIASSSVPVSPVSTIATPPVVMRAVPVAAPYGPPVGPQFVQAAAQQDYSYAYGYAPQQKPDGPLKRFLRGAADGFMLGTMGWLG
ncbi:hypothetical protein V3C99_014787, partial [Haemonchus contortus]